MPSKSSTRSPRTPPGARVYIRLIVEASEADWPLTRKFGCAATEAPDLVAHASALGLVPVGLSFHVGSQTRRAEMWSPILAQVARVWHGARAAGHDLTLLNIGGGFPAFYGEEIARPEAYGARVMELVALYFGAVPHVMAEPGRGLVAEAGAIAAEVLLVSKKSQDELHRWVYLDIGPVFRPRRNRGRGDPLPDPDSARPRTHGSLHPCRAVLRQCRRAL